MNDAAYKSLIKLPVDICKRNGIKELKWKADKSLIGQVDKQNMTVHRWFANKSCPGDYLYNLHGQIAKEVNAQLGSGTSSMAKKTLYRVRKTWKDVKSQKGAFNDLLNAKKCADKNKGGILSLMKTERQFTHQKPRIPQALSRCRFQFQI